MNEIETPRMKLRPFRMEDVDIHQQVIYGDPVVAEYLTLDGLQPISETRSVIEWWVEHQEAHGFAPWAVIHKETGQWMGQCGLMYVPRTDDGTIELLYAYGKEFWRQGYGTEAAYACLRYGFEAAALDRVDAFAIPDNIASQRVMQKVGMTYQATDDRYYTENGHKLRSFKERKTVVSARAQYINMYWRVMPSPAKSSQHPIRSTSYSNLKK